jgi:hypothetical protein
LLSKTKENDVILAAATNALARDLFMITTLHSCDAARSLAGLETATRYTIKYLIV